jgi:hypothetical protein
MNRTKLNKSTNQLSTVGKISFELISIGYTSKHIHPYNNSIIYTVASSNEILIADYMLYRLQITELRPEIEVGWTILVFCFEENEMDTWNSDSEILNRG